MSAHLERSRRRFHRAYDKALKDLGRFNLLIFGKTGVGKSTLINAVFADDVAKTGSGRPVTVKTEYFEHPSGILGIYDSEGIEIGQEGDQILERFRQIIAETRQRDLSEQIHVVWYCVRASDLRFEDGQAEFINAFAAEGLPIILVLTQVAKRRGQIKPEVQELATSIIDRELPLAPANQVFFTMAKPDEFDDLKAHGLQQLLDATFQVAPQGVERAQTAAQQIDIRRKTAEAERVLGEFVPLDSVIDSVSDLFAQTAATIGVEIGDDVLALLVDISVAATGYDRIDRRLLRALLTKLGQRTTAVYMSYLDTYERFDAIGRCWIIFCTQLYELDSDDLEGMSPHDLESLFVETLRELL
jgi:predicted GTPase